MSKDPRVARPHLTNRLIQSGAWGLHTAPANIIKVRFTNLRCREAGVKEDPLLVHATRLANELEAISAKDVQQVFGLPLNLSRKLLEMLLYRDLIEESNKRKYRLSGRKEGFLFEEDPNEEKRHRKDPLFDQLFVLTEAGKLASDEGEIRPVVSLNKTMYMIEETGEFLPLNAIFDDSKKWKKVSWKKTRKPSIAVVSNWFVGEERNLRRVDDTIEGVSITETSRKDDFGQEMKVWKPTAIKSFERAVVPGIWISRTLVGTPAVNLNNVIQDGSSLVTSMGVKPISLNSKLSGSLGTINIRGETSKPRVHKNMLSVEVSNHSDRDLPNKSPPEPHRGLFDIGDEERLEASVRPIPAQNKMKSWIEDAIDAAMRKLPDGSLGRSGVEAELIHLRNATAELWLDEENLPQKWIANLQSQLESINLDMVLQRYRSIGEWELQYRIDEAEVFIHAN